MEVFQPRGVGSHGFIHYYLLSIIQGPQIQCKCCTHSDVSHVLLGA